MQIITCNDDYTTAKSNVRTLVSRDPRPLFIGIQEGKAENYREMLGKRWLVRQVVKTQAKSGSAVIIDRDQMTPVTPRNDSPAVRGWGLMLLAKRDKGDQMLDRYIVWQDVRLKGNNQVIRLASCHRPPQREKDDWGEFDRNLASWTRASPVPVVVAMDANQPKPKFTGLKWTGIGIDGFAHSASLKLLDAALLPKNTSDHSPVMCKLKP